MKFYKGLLHFIQIFVVLVVLPRVADFVGQLGPVNVGLDFHDLIRFAFAATLGLGTVGTAYFSDETQPPQYDDEPANPRERRRREREAAYYATMLQAVPYARRAMWLFAILDGSFNLAEAVRGAAQNGLFDVERLGNFLVGIYGSAAVLFGIAPTVLAIVLSRVISMVDRIPEDYERPISKKEFDILRTIMGNLGLKEYRSGDAALLLSGALSAEEGAVRSPARSTNERRTSGLLNNGRHEQRDRIYAYINQIWEAVQHTPGTTEISHNCTVAKSYAHEVLQQWRNQFDPWQRGPETG